MAPGLEIPVLCRLAIEKLVCVEGGIVNVVDDAASSGQSFISLSGINKPISEFGRLVDIENFQYLPVLSSTIDSKCRAIDEEVMNARNEKKDLQNLAKNNEFYKFLQSFFQLLAKSSDEEHQANQVVSAKKVIDAAVPVKASDGIHGPEGSLLRRVLKQNLLLTSGPCYFLVPRNSADGLDEYAVLNGKVHSLEYFAMLDGFEQIYKNEIAGRLNSLSESMLEGRRRIAKETIDEAKAIEQRKISIPAHDKFGHLIDGDDYYVWVLREKFSLQSNSRVASSVRDTTWYDFPSCKVGVRLVKKNGSITFENVIYALESKSMKNGVETGEMVGLKGKEFRFPATDNGAETGYPSVCITGNHFEPIRKLDCIMESKIRQLLNTACSIMVSGYADGKNPAFGLYIYMPIDKNLRYYHEFISPNQNRGQKQ